MSDGTSATPGRASDRAAPNILVSPLKSRFNRFITRFGETLGAAGLQTAELDWRLASMRRSDFILLHWPDAFFGWRGLPRTAARLAKLLAARAAGAKLVWLAHNVVPHGGGRSPGPLMPIFLRAIDGVIFMSDASRDAALERYPQLRRTRQLVTVHGLYPPVVPLPEPRAPVSGEPVRLLNFGLLRPYKNVEALIEAAAAEPDDAHLLVLGYAADGDYGAALAASAGPNTRIEARRESVSEEDLEQAIDAADLVVLPYRNIMHSGSAIHALSRNRPVVVPATGAMPELQALMGEAWVFTYQGEFDRAVLKDALAWVRQARPATPPLDRLDWARVERDLSGFIAGF